MNFHAKMVINGKGISCALLTALLLSNVPSQAADAVTVYKAQPRGSNIKIEGDSTIHKWTMEGPIIGGSMELEPGVKLDSAQADIEGLKEGKLNAKVQASIPVRRIKSGHDIMDGLYQEALLEPKFPQIIYNLLEMKVKPGHVAGTPFEFDTKGKLSFAGVTNTVSMPVKITAGNARLKIVGNCPLKMTAFGIKPPAPNIGLGLMRCEDDVNIVFEWALAIPAPVVADKK